MIENGIEFIYDVNGYHTVLSVQRDWENPGNEIYGLAEIFIRVIEDNKYNAEIILDQMIEHFGYKQEREDTEI